MSCTFFTVILILRFNGLGGKQFKINAVTYSFYLPKPDIHFTGCKYR